MTQAEQAPKLKPCPFCGEAVQMNDYTNRPAAAWVMVHRCKVIGPIKLDAWSGATLAENWNTRAVPTTAEVKRCPEAAAMSAVLRQIREALPHVDVVQDADREIVNDLIRRAEVALAPVAREG